MPHSHTDSTSTVASDVLTASTTASSITGSPNPGSNTTSAARMNPGQLSPALAGFSFDDDVDPATPARPLSQEDSDAGLHKKNSTRPIHWDAPGSPRDIDPARKESRVADGRRMTKFFDDTFAYKEDWESSAREQISNDAPIIVELRTNVIIKDEYSLVMDLSSHVATRFQRAESAVMITVTHSSCLMYGGTFEPAYLLSISALASLCQATTNKRNTALTQAFLSEVLSVPAERGIIRFEPLPEDCLGTSGRTVLAEIERQENESGSSLKRVLTNKSARKSIIGSLDKRRSVAPDRRKSVAPDKRKSFVSFGRDLSRKESVRSHDSLRSSSSISPPIPPFVFHDPAPPSLSVDPALSLSAKSKKSPKKRASAMNYDTTDQLLSEASRVLEQVSDSKQSLLSPQPPPNAHSYPSSSESRRSKLNIIGGPIYDPYPASVPPPPAIPYDDPSRAQKMSRRKSFVALFKR